MHERLNSSCVDLTANRNVGKESAKWLSISFLQKDVSSPEHFLYELWVQTPEGDRKTMAGSIEALIDIRASVP